MVAGPSQQQALTGHSKPLIFISGFNKNIKIKRPQGTKLYKRNDVTTSVRFMILSLIRIRNIRLLRKICR